MSEPNANSHEAGPKRELIYVVDDEPMLLELASVILEPVGYVVRTFRDPDSAVQAFNAARPRPQLVITDYAMHSLNGLELIAACRRVEPKQKILLISGTVGPEIFHNASSKPDGFLAKPYHAKLLVDTVESMLK